MGRDGRKTADGERHLPHRIVASLHIYQYNRDSSQIEEKFEGWFDYRWEFEAWWWP
jgi:hypothetical protein